MAKRKPGISDQAFIRSVGSEKGQLAPVYAFVGENAYMARKCSEALRERFSREGAGDAINIFVGDESPEIIFDQLRTADLFASKRLVVMLQGDTFLKTNIEAVSYYLERPSAGCVLALTCLKLDARTRLAKRVIALGSLVNCQKLYPDKVVGWVHDRFRDRDRSCAAGVAETLVEEIGQDLFALEAEVEKLCAYATGRRKIELKDVRALVGHDRRLEVFALTDAVGRRDPGRALGILADLTDAGEAPERLIAQLAWQFRRLWTAKRLMDNGLTPADVGRELRIYSRFLGGLIEQVRCFSQQELSRLYRLLAQTDLALKTGRLDRKIAVEQFVVQACASGVAPKT